MGSWPAILSKCIECERSRDEVSYGARGLCQRCYRTLHTTDDDDMPRCLRDHELRRLGEQPYSWLVSNVGVNHVQSVLRREACRVAGVAYTRWLDGVGVPIDDDEAMTAESAAWVQRIVSEAKTIEDEDLEALSKLATENERKRRARLLTDSDDTAG